jgi:hypothetical protein
MVGGGLAWIEMTWDGCSEDPVGSAMLLGSFTFTLQHHRS